VIAPLGAGAWLAAEQPDGNLEEYRLLSEGRIRYRTYERAGLTQPERMAEIWNGIRRGERARVAGSLPIKMAPCDNRLALVPVSTSGSGADQAGYLVHPSSLLDALCDETWGPRPGARTPSFIHPRASRQ
jgi:hypothetical protein